MLILLYAHDLMLCGEFNEDKSKMTVSGGEEGLNCEVIEACQMRTECSRKVPNRRSCGFDQIYYKCLEFATWMCK